MYDKSIKWKRSQKQIKSHIIQIRLFFKNKNGNVPKTENQFTNGGMDMKKKIMSLMA